MRCCVLLLLVVTALLSSSSASDVTQELEQTQQSRRQGLHGLERRSLDSSRSRGANAEASHGDDDEPTCSCDCCDVVKRRPDEFLADVKIKCVPAGTHSTETCSNQCTAPDSDRILQTQDKVLDYQRFCFFECKPVEGPSSPVTSQCVALSDADTLRVVDAAGNAMDPAFVYASDTKHHAAALVAAVHSGPAPAAPPVVKTGDEAKSDPTITEDPDQISDTKARQSAAKGRAWSAKESQDARGQAVLARDHEANAATDLNARLQGMMAPMQPGVVAFHMQPADDVSEDGAEAQANDAGAEGLDAAYGAGPLADIHTAMRGAKAASDKAVLFAERAVEAVKAANQQNWKLAVNAAAVEMGKVKAQAVASAKAEAERVGKMSSANGVKASLAAAKASEPYFVSMLRAQASARDYTTRASQLAAKAMSLQSQAKGLETDADALNKAGQGTAAQSEISQAQDVDRQAQDLAKQARQMFDTADETSRTIPMYQAAARAAGARAAYDSNPAWAPGLSGPR